MMDDEKTNVGPRFFGMAAKTVVMKSPPRMTMAMAAFGSNDSHAEPAPSLRLTPKPPVVPAARREFALPLPQEQSQLTRPNWVAVPRHIVDPMATRLVIPPPQMRQSAARPPVEITAAAWMRGPNTCATRALRPAQRMPAMSPFDAGPSQPPSMPTMVVAAPGKGGFSALRNRLQQQNSKRIALAAAAALLVVVVLILPRASPSASSQTTASTNMPPRTRAVANPPPAEAVASVAEHASPRTFNASEDPAVSEKASAKEEPRNAKTSQALALGARSEETAAAMLLSGRRRQALALYKELAKSSEASPGIEAMVLVLSKKVAPQ